MQNINLKNETKKIFEKYSIWLITNLQPSSRAVYIFGIDNVGIVFDMIYPLHNSDPLSIDRTKIRFLATWTWRLDFFLTTRHFLAVQT